MILYEGQNVSQSFPRKDNYRKYMTPQPFTLGEKPNIEINKKHRGKVFKISLCKIFLRNLAGNCVRFGGHIRKKLVKNPINRKTTN